MYFTITGAKDLVREDVTLKNGFVKCSLFVFSANG